MMKTGNNTVISVNIYLSSFFILYTDDEFND